ncbi:MAG TPA: hypothetical protein VGI28_09290 [Stellaceae bacterium]
MTLGDIGSEIGGHEYRNRLFCAACRQPRAFFADIDPRWGGDGLQMRQEALGEVCPDAGEAEHVSVAGGIDCLLLVLNAICHCPSHSKARS